MRQIVWIVCSEGFFMCVRLKIVGIWIFNETHVELFMDLQTRLLFLAECWNFTWRTKKTVDFINPKDVPSMDVWKVRVYSQFPSIYQQLPFLRQQWVTNKAEGVFFRFIEKKIKSHSKCYSNLQRDYMRQEFK